MTIVKTNGPYLNSSKTKKKKEWTLSALYSKDTIIDHKCFTKIPYHMQESHLLSIKVLLAFEKLLVQTYHKFEHISIFFQ